jgi:hypothetical protein
VNLINYDGEFVRSDETTIFVLLIVAIMIAIKRSRGSNTHKLTNGTNTQEEAPMTVNIL